MNRRPGLSRTVVVWAILSLLAAWIIFSVLTSREPELKMVDPTNRSETVRKSSKRKADERRGAFRTYYGEPSSPNEIRPGTRLDEHGQAKLGKGKHEEAPPSIRDRSVKAELKATVKLPPKTKVIGKSIKKKDNLKQTVIKLESRLSPDKLQVFYTDELVEDWIIFRDDLTEGIGWNGIFLQLEPEEKTIGIFAVVKKIGPPSGPGNPTRISIIKEEKAR